MHTDEQTLSLNHLPPIFPAGPGAVPILLRCYSTVTVVPTSMVGAVTSTFGTQHINSSPISQAASTAAVGAPRMGQTNATQGPQTSVVKPIASPRQIIAMAEGVN